MRTTERSLSGRNLASHGEQRIALRTRPRALAFAVAAAFLPWWLPQAAHGQTPPPPAPNTLPTNGGYVAGDGRILPPTPENYLRIEQASQKGIINWDTFSIGSAAHVHFQHDAGRQGLTLNRVTGSDLSQIFGRLTADGQIFLSNPNGALFARGASVEVGALFATSLSIQDHDFLAGRYLWSNSGNAGSVINEGSIITTNGYAALAGPEVRNDGIIIAQAGSVTLAAGDRVSLDMVGDGLIRVSVDQAAMNASAINTGTIQADGGRVLLTARSANALLDTVVNNTGHIRANTISERNGEIVLDGGNAGVVSNSGTLRAAGVDVGTTGGTVKVLGQYVGLFDGTRIDASGDTGGGTVLVGGNFQGNGPEQNAFRTYVAANATINADAVTNGDGGKVIVWSDDVTRYFGNISARGGAQSGDGGFVEVSGRDYLDYRGTTDTRAPHGRVGTLLLDPNDLTITHDTGIVTTSINATTPFVAAATGAVLSDFVINGELNRTNVTITSADSSITIDTNSVALGPHDAGGGPGTNTGGGAPNTTNANTLLLSAGTTISWTSAWSYTNDGALTLRAGTNAVSGGISGTGGALSVIGTGGLELTTALGTIDVLTATDKIAAFAPDGVTISNTAPGGTLTIDQVGVTIGVSTSDNPISLTEQGSVTVNEPIDAGTSTVDINFGGSGAAVFTANAAITSGSATITGGANGDTFNINTALTANLLGGDGVDVFNLNATLTGDVDGQVDGGTLDGTQVVNATLTAAGGTTGFNGTTDAAALVGTFSNITTINANGGGTLTGTNAPATWAITTADSGTYTTTNVLTFTNFPNLTGGTGTDAFTLSGTGSVTGTITGGGVATGNTLTARDVANTWTINAADAGSVTNVNAFVGVGNLVGGTSTDSFTLTGGGTLSGSINGGAGTDTLAGSTTYVVTALNGGTATGVTGGFTNVENLTGTAGADTFTLNGGTLDGAVDGLGGTDTLAGSTTYVVTALNGGTATGVTGGFTNVENLTGTAGADTFTLTTGTLAGAINGLGGTDTLAGSTTYVVTALNGGTATGVTGEFTNVESLTGTAGADTFTLTTGTLSGAVNGLGGGDTLTAGNGANVWTITGVDSGTVTGVGTGFTNVANLVGGGSTDSFTVAGGSINSINGGAGTDTLAGSASYTITALDAGSATGVTSFTSIENLTGTGTSTLQATGATWNINTANGGTVTNLSGQFAGMANLADLGTGTFNMNAGSLSGSLGGGANGSLSYVGRAGPVFFDVSNRAALTTGVGTTYSGITSVTGSAASDTILGSGATYTLTGPNAGNSGGISWTSFENITNTGVGTFNFIGGSLSRITNTGAATFDSATNITVVAVIGGTLNLTGAAAQWVLASPSSVNGSTTNPAGITYNAAPIGGITPPDIYFNGPSVSGPTGGAVGGASASIGGTIAEIAAQSLQESFGTDSVGEQIEYGFAGDVGATPPMDHRLEETGISVPDCFNQSRDGEACK